MIIKTVKITNPKNVLVQIPLFIVEKWCLNTNDSVEVITDDDGQTVKLKPKKGLKKVSIGS